LSEHTHQQRVTKEIFANVEKDQDKKTERKLKECFTPPTDKMGNKEQTPVGRGGGRTTRKKSKPQWFSRFQKRLELKQKR